MKGEIILSGQAYGIRCDMNVIEAIEDHFGGIAEITKQRSVSATKFLAAEMMNEHWYAASSPERVTPEWVGMQMLPTEYADVWQNVIQCFIDSVSVKKK